MAWRKYSKSRQAYRKRYRLRRRGARRFGRGVMSSVRRMLASRAETKVSKAQLTYTVSNDRVAYTQPLGLIVRGTSQNERIGESIRLVGYKLVWSFTPTANRWQGNTRLRVMIVQGQAWAAASSLFVPLSSGTEDQVFDKVAPRNGAEVWNSDMGRLLKQTEQRFPNYLVMSTTQNPNEAPPTDTILSHNWETNANTIRGKLWFPAKQRIVKWRSPSEQYSFTASQPNICVYAYNCGAGVGYGFTLGTLYMTIHVYYKDM